MTLQTAIETTQVDKIMVNEESSVYVLNGETNETTGPYTLEDITHWYINEDLDDSMCISINGSEWKLVSSYFDSDSEVKEGKKVVGDSNAMEVYALGSDNEVNGP